MTGPVRVMVVDDHFLFAQAVASLIGGGAGFTITGIAVTGPQALAMARESRPNVVLLDYHLPGYEATDLLPRLKAAAPGVAVIVLTSDTSAAARERATAAGADAFMTKDQAIDDVLAVLGKVSAQMSRPSVGNALQVSTSLGAPLSERLESLARRAGADAVALFARIPDQPAPVWAAHNLPVNREWMDSAVRDLIAMTLVRGTRQRRSAVGISLANGRIAEWLVVEPIGRSGVAGALVALREQGTFDGDERVAAAALEAEGELAILAGVIKEKAAVAPEPEPVEAKVEAVSEQVSQPEPQASVPVEEPLQDLINDPEMPKESRDPNNGRRGVALLILALALTAAIGGLLLPISSLLVVAVALLVLAFLIYLY